MLVMSANKPAIPTEPPDLNETLLSWKGPSHPFIKRGPLYYQTIAAITLLLSITAFFLFRDILMIGAIVSVAFVVNVLSKVEPVETEHKVSRIGFDNAGRLYKWFELYAFWFETKWNQKVLVFQTRLPFPGQVRAVVTGISEDKLKDVIGRYILYSKEPIKSWFDHASDWLAKKIPMETTS